MNYDKEKIEQALRKAYKNLELENSEIDDAIFHMVDWLEDLDKWSQFCKNPASLNSEELGEIVIQFLVHVPAHVAAASKLVTGLPVSDVFEVNEKTEENS